MVERTSSCASRAFAVSWSVRTSPSTNVAVAVRRSASLEVRRSCDLRADLRHARSLQLQAVRRLRCESGRRRLTVGLPRLARVPYRAVRDTIKACGRQLRVLEVGSGLGYLTYSLRQAGHEAYGIDLSQEAVAKANKRFGRYYESGNMAEWRSSFSEPFDLVVAQRVRGAHQRATRVP